MESKATLSAPSSSVPNVPVNLNPRLCAADECNVVLLRGRFCMGCLAEAAVDCARRIEASLINEGLEPRSQDLHAAVVGYPTALRIDWFQSGSPLGEIGYAEAVQLRSLTEAACLLVSLGGVAALDKLPGLNRPAASLPLRSAEPRKPAGADPLAALPGRQQAGTRRKMSFQSKFQLGCAVFLVFVAFLVGVNW